MGSDFQGSRWFKRGWTLQELLGPTSVDFFSREGDLLGSRESLKELIHNVTRIPVGALRGENLKCFPVEERLSWAKRRESKREEDKAYSPLGIFDIQMSLFYEEGEEKALARLQRKLRKSMIKDETSVIRDQNRRQHHNVANWISSIDFAAQQSDVINRRQKGTGEWFTESPQFRNWLHGSKQTLFCPGIPGAGKTMISAIRVSHLWEHMQDEDIGVAYLYCNYKTQADQKVTDLAATILRQLIQEQTSIPEPVTVLYNGHLDRRTRPSLEEIQTVLGEVASNSSNVYVVIDGLDECLDHDGSRSQLLVMLRDLQSKVNLSLMATSRFIPEVMQNFSLSPTLEVRASTFDVNQFFAGQICRLPGFVQRDDGLQKAI